MTESQVIPVYIVLQYNALLLDVAGPAEVMRRAMVEAPWIGFEVNYVSPRPDIMTSMGLPLRGLAPLPSAIADNAMVMLCGASSTSLDPSEFDEQAADSDRSRIVSWLREVVGSRHTLVSICAGALLAGEAGLLDGHECTTHHASCDELRAMAPRAHVLDNRLFVQSGNVYSSAGITAGTDLMLHIVAGLIGPGKAAAIARYLVVYMRRSGSDPQLSVWLEGRNHMHPAIHRVQDAMTANPGHDWSLEELAGVGRLSPRHLSRLFRQHAGRPITDYLNALRIALATDLLQQTRLGMEDVCEQSGFASTRHMRRVWRQFHSTPPSALRRASVRPSG
ncbi:MAG TPA: helix-turn-helix domain-containing protein [Devosiaceae bacterium]